MKQLFAVITLLILIVGCTHIVTGDLLIDREGVKYQEDSKKPYSGKVYELWDTGNKKFEGSYSKGKEDGIWTWWYYGGQKMSEGTFTNGERDGIWTWWYERGMKEREETYTNGVLNGKSTFWRENGQILGETTYKNGKKVWE